MVMHEPVIYDALSEQRDSTSPATSSGTLSSYPQPVLFPQLEQV